MTRASLEGPAERAAPSGEAPDPPEIVVAWTPLPDDYYKHFRETTGAITAPPKEREGYAPQLWLDTRCTKPLLSYRAVEWDWLTFFFNVTSASTSSPTPFQRLHAMYQRACAGGTEPDECDGWDGVKVGSDYFVGFEQLRSAAYDEYYAESHDPNDPRFVRFRNALEAHGVNH